MRDSGECHVVLFLGLGDPMESYEGGEEPFDLRSGPVKAERALLRLGIRASKARTVEAQP
jgi:hypothetical protein